MTERDKIVGLNPQPLILGKKTLGQRVQRQRYDTHPNTTDSCINDSPAIKPSKNRLNAD